MNKLAKRLEQGLLRLYILWRASKQQVSGIDLLKVEREHEHELSAGILYPALHRLVKDGYLTLKKTVEHGKVHKYYRITKSGKDALEKAKESFGEPMKEFLREWLKIPRKEEEKTLSLIDLKNGESGTIISIKAGHRAAQRLADMGLTPGTKITVAKSAPLDGPIEILARDSKLVIGRGLASKVFVRVEEK